MADFHTHVTVSSVLGCGYSVAGMVAGMHPSTALVAGGLCGVAGMLPDVDSDSGIPRREAMGFAAAIVPMLLVDRFEQFNWAHDERVLAAAAIYFFIRFVAAKLIGKWSVHRGMWHSIPAVLIFAGVAFLIAGPADDLTIRYFKAFAVALGAMSHLVLDEIYSVDTRGIVPKFKKSFGTAVKLWGKNGWANFSTYAKLAVVVCAISAEPAVLSRISEQHPELANQIRGYSDRVQSYRPSQILSQQATNGQPANGMMVTAQPGVAPGSGFVVGGSNMNAHLQTGPQLSSPGTALPSPAQPQPTQAYPPALYSPSPYATQQPAAPQPTGQQPRFGQPGPSPWQQQPAFAPQGASPSPFPSQAQGAPAIRRQ